MSNNKEQEKESNTSLLTTQFQLNMHGTEKHKFLRKGDRNSKPHFTFFSITHTPSVMFVRGKPSSFISNWNNENKSNSFHLANHSTLTKTHKKTSACTSIPLKQNVLLSKYIAKRKETENSQKFVGKMQQFRNGNRKQGFIPPDFPRRPYQSRGIEMKALRHAANLKIEEIERAWVSVYCIRIMRDGFRFD